MMYCFKCKKQTPDKDIKEAPPMPNGARRQMATCGVCGSRKSGILAKKNVGGSFSMPGGSFAMPGGRR